MQCVIQFQTFLNKINKLTIKYNKKTNKRNKGITEVKIAPLILVSLSFGHVPRHSNLLPELDDEKSVFK